MQQNMKGHPKIVCPNCGARLMNAADRETKNGTVTEMPVDSHEYDYFIFCKKCNHYIGIKNTARHIRVPI